MRRLAETRSALAAAPLAVVTRVQSRVLAGPDREAGMTTAEYAVGTGLSLQQRSSEPCRGPTFVATDG